jgi:hypothetical protein
MEKMYARCGLDCAACPAFEATRKNDDGLRAKVAGDWSAQFNAVILPADVNCVGCLAEGTHFNYCQMCEIRKCATEKRVDNCAVCPEFGCERITGFMNMAPKAKENLEALRG